MAQTSREDATNAYTPQVPVTKRSEGGSEDLWARLLSEAEEADRAALQGEPFHAPEAEAAEPAPFEERYEKLMGVVSNKPSHREMLLRTLAFCTEERPFPLVEETIAGYPEFEVADQNPYRLIMYLVDGGGLEMFEVDADGAHIETARKEGLTEDEIDDMIAGYALASTDVGTKLAEDLSTERRLNDLFSMFSDRASHYLDLLDFCKDPRTFKDIEKLFAGRDLSALKTLHPESGLAIKPTVFVDNMEKAGAIVWKGNRWVITKEGEAFLELISRSGL